VDRVLGGNRVFGSVAIEIAPLAGLVPGGAGRPAGHAVPVNSRTQLSWDEENPVPERFREALEESVLMSLQVGPRFGFPMTGCKIRLGAGERSPERETELGFCQAAANALRQALGEARVTLLEPVMAFDIEAPAEFMSGIIGELNAKKAEIEDLEVDGDMRRVLGEVPLCRMFGYATTLRSLSQGRATFSLTPAGFCPVPEEELEARGLTWQ
jgi:elongation factor G